MILCVGDRIKMGHMVEVLENRLKEEISFVPESPDIRQQENSILLAAQGAKAILYDTRQYFNDGEEITEIIKRIYRANKATVILLVPTINPNNEIVKAALARQMKHFINTALSPGEQKEQLEKILTGYYAANGREDIQDAEQAVHDETKTLNEFVGELYDAKQREEEKENTVIIRKKGTTQVLLEFLRGFTRTAFSILALLLMAVAVIVLLYPNTRDPLIENIEQIWQDVLSGLR